MMRLIVESWSYAYVCDSRRGERAGHNSRNPLRFNAARCITRETQRPTGAQKVSPGGMFHNERGFEGLTNIWLTPKALIDSIARSISTPAPPNRPFDIASEHTERITTILPCSRLQPPYGPHTGAWMDRLADHGNGIGLIARTDRPFNAP